MKTFDTLLIILLLFIILTAGCSKFSNHYPDGDFKILIMSDIHIKNSTSRDTRLANMVKDINEKKYPGIEFVVTTGDNATSFYDNYYPDSLDKSYNRLGRFVEIMSKLNVPKYFAVGNHDYKIESDRDSDAPYDKGEIEKLNKMWTDITGFQPYYSFIHKEWKFIVLNSMSGRYMNRFFDEDQLNWLEKELKDEKPTLLFFHHPLTTDKFKIWGGPNGMITVNKEPKFYAILDRHKNQIKGIFVGHGHLWVNDKLFNKIKVYETASFGDDESNPYYVVGFDNKNYSISVARSPFEFAFTQNYSNPFNPTTKINYSIPKQNYVSLKVFDVLGREIETLINKEQPQGNYSIEFDASMLTSGIYFYKIQAGSFVDTKKMVFMK